MTEEVPPIVSEESRVEEAFTEVEQRGLAWRQRGILPLLMVSTFSWGIKFPTVPGVVRGATADSLPESSHFGVRVLVRSRTFCSQQEPLLQVAARGGTSGVLRAAERAHLCCLTRLSIVLLRTTSKLDPRLF